jgi:hypothetical protein
METQTVTIKAVDAKAWRHFKAEAALHAFSQAEMLRWLMQQAGCLPASPSEALLPAAAESVQSGSSPRAE